MAFGRREYVFSHTITIDSEAHRPAVFSVDLGDLVGPWRECSPMFLVDSVSVVGYKRDTLQKVPIQFAVLNSTMTRALTNDPRKLSTGWNVDLEGLRSLKIAGTNERPFRRSFSAHDDEDGDGDGNNRLALLNALAFVTTESLLASDKARGSLDLLKSHRESKTFTVDCERCGTESRADLTASENRRPSLRLPLCSDGYVCVPRRTDGRRDDADRRHRSLIRLLWCAYKDDLTVVREAARFAGSAVGHAGQEPRAPFRPDGRDAVHLPYELVEFVVRLYGTLSEYADNLAVVHATVPHVKVLIESPSENLGHVSGSMTLTLLHGASALCVYRYVSAGVSDEHEPGFEDLEDAVAQFGYDELIRRFPMDFGGVRRDMSLTDWCRFHQCELEDVG